MAGVVTRKFRKIRMLRDELREKASENLDIIWYLLFVFFGAFSVLLASIFLIWLTFWLGWLDIESLKPTIIKILSLFLTSSAAIISGIFGLYSKTGAFLKSLQESGNKPKQELDNNGYSVTSTYLKGSTDVIFEQYNEKRDSKSS